VGTCCVIPELFVETKLNSDKLFSNTVQNTTLSLLIDGFLVIISREF